ncbi:hypothetical protein UPYG_G00203210 [Umbra pygmaea]|uniref:von Willebrand factor A domain-containing protein 5A-like n=1 Tax=Umbra pygmaea TaxID=75934 RepID=A0ABD0WNY2_UMBPY
MVEHGDIFLFTDGEVWNTKEILDLVTTNASSHRLFSFGIGEGASSALISGAAKQGGGHAQFITGQDRMQPKVMQSLRYALQPAVVDISVTWDVPKGVSVTPLSPPIRVVFQGQRALLYAQLTGETSGNTEGSVTVKYRLAEQPVENQLRFSLKPAEDTGLTVHRLGAQTLIRSLEVKERESDGDEKEGVKGKIVELSVQSGVSSAFTAFIAVYKGDGKAVQGPLLRRQVPTSMKNGRQLPLILSCIRAASKALGSIGTMNSVCSLRAFSGSMKRSMPMSAHLTKSARMASCDTLMDDQRSSFDECKEDSSASVSTPVNDPLLQLISLQKASGCWVLELAFAEVLGKTMEDVSKPKPAQVDQEVWATVLALVWLYGFKMEAQEEWQFVVMKAVSWIKAQKEASLSECVLAGNQLLGCQVQMDTMGI